MVFEPLNVGAHRWALGAGRVDCACRVAGQQASLPPSCLISSPRPRHAPGTNAAIQVAVRDMPQWKLPPPSAGTNAAIQVAVRDMPKWKPAGVSSDAATIVNTEWGCYGNGRNLLPRCQEDRDLDAASVQKGEGRMVGWGGGLDAASVQEGGGRMGVGGCGGGGGSGRSQRT